MTRALAGCLALLVASCAAPLPPKPPPAPVAETPAPVTPPALRIAYTKASDQLRIYLAQPICVPSGAVACRDPIEAHDALAAKRRAMAALDGLRRGRVTVHLAKTRVAAFQAVVGNLSIGTPQ